MWTTARRLLAGRQRLASSATPAHIIATTHHVGVALFSTSSSTLSAPGPLARLGRFIRKALGQKDAGPRELQEKKDLYWTLLATTHRDLRIKEQAGRRTDSTTPAVWAYESRDDLRRTMEESVQHLDDEVKVNEMSLAQIRKQVQSRIESQVIGALEGAQVLEQAMEDLHGNRDADDDEYKLSSQEEEKFSEVLVKEYGKTVDAIGKKAPVKRRTSDPIPFLVTKKDAIETVLDHFGWRPEKNLRSNEMKDDYVDAFGFKPNQAEADMVGAMRYYHARNLVRSSLAHCILQEDGEAHRQRSHSLIPFKSTLEEAGRGVFVDGFAPAGTLMAFFPGKVWPKERLSAASVQSQMELANDPLHQLAMRYDDYLIDSRMSPYTVVNNLWAIAHIVNHPPLRKTGEEEDVFGGPNCVTCSINFTEAMFRDQQDKLRDYLPNEYEHPPQEWTRSFFDDEKVVMHGLALFALRDLEDEELFFDYRLSPDDREPNGLQYPHWYRVIDEEAVKNRWNLDEDQG